MWEPDEPSPAGLERLIARLEEMVAHSRVLPLWDPDELLQGLLQLEEGLHQLRAPPLAPDRVERAFALVAHLERWVFEQAGYPVRH